MDWKETSGNSEKDKFGDERLESTAVKHPLQES